MAVHFQTLTKSRACESSVAAPIRWNLLAVISAAVFLFALFAAGMVLIPRYQAVHPINELQRSDADKVQVDDIYLDTTLVTPSFLKERHLQRYVGHRDPSTVLPVLLGLNTHKGTVEHMHHMGGHFIFTGPDGAQYPAITEPIVLTQHHNAYMVLFPAKDNRGQNFLDMQSGKLKIEVMGVGAKEMREFEWQLPVHDSPIKNGTVATLMLAVALIGALLIVLSPCALELSFYYSAIISCTVAEGERQAALTEGSESARAGRRRILTNLAAFIAGFTSLYAISGASVGLIGQGVRRPLGQYAGIIQIIGGSFILLFAFRVFGLDRYLKNLFEGFKNRSTRLKIVAVQKQASSVRRLLTWLRMRGMANSKIAGGMRPRDSFMVGMGLSSACLTCMGGAVLYPLLVYAGITSWISGLLTLTLYSLGIALPMVFIALGFFNIRMSLVKRLGFNRILRMASGLMLAIIGLLIISGHERIITDLAFGMLGSASRWVSS